MSAKLTGSGAKPHKRRKRRERDEPNIKTGMGEFGRGTLLYSPYPVANSSAFRSFGFASLVGRCPTPCKGAAPRPLPGNQSEMTLAVIGWTPALAFAR